MEEGIVLLTALCAVDFGHLVRQGCLSDYLPSAAASRSEAASSFRAFRGFGAVRSRRLLQHKHIGFDTVGRRCLLRIILCHCRSYRPDFN